MFRYLVRVSKKNHSAHIWTGQDTSCRMWLSGGIVTNGVRIASTQMGRNLCKLCAEASGAQNTPGVAPVGDINAICRSLEAPAGRAKEKPHKKPKKRSSGGHQQASRKMQASHGAAFINGINVTTPEFLNTYEWRRVRMEALKKYGPRCQCCGASPETGAVMNVDHIKPRKLYPHLALDIDNLQILCHECNHGKGNWDMTDWRNQEEEIDPDALSHLRSIMRGA